MIAQAFQQWSNALSKATANHKHTHAPSNTFDGLDLQLSEPPTAPIVHISNVVPLNAVKHALELSPGPKSPLALQAQKCCKSINTMHLTSSSNNSDRVESQADKIVLILTSNFPALTSAPSLMCSMNIQPLFKQGNAFQNVITFLKHLQSADLASLDFDEDDKGKGWGHYQFMAGGITLSSSLTTWQEVGSVSTTFKLVVAALTMCQEAWQMCRWNANEWLHQQYLPRNTLECLEQCWVAVGRMIASSPHAPVLPTTPTHGDTAMLQSLHGLTIKLKWPSTDIIINTQDGSMEANLTTYNQPASNIEPMQELSEASNKDHTDAAAHKLLQVLELQTLLSDFNITVPKLKCKDDIIVAMVKCPELMQVPKSTIDDIIEKYINHAWHNLD
ncbi:hypothetical protein EI94DRAFT_1707732 [Lactarius quietus]|nr:hypothetical protein EI94DRAFT_1707732 [Lactarius quietus]